MIKSRVENDGGQIPVRFGFLRVDIIRADSIYIRRNAFLYKFVEKPRRVFARVTYVISNRRRRNVFFEMFVDINQYFSYIFRFAYKFGVVSCESKFLTDEREDIIDAGKSVILIVFIRNKIVYNGENFIDESGIGD